MAARDVMPLVSIFVSVNRSCTVSFLTSGSPLALPAMREGAIAATSHQRRARMPVAAYPLLTFDVVSHTRTLRRCFPVASSPSGCTALTLVGYCLGFDRDFQARLWDDNSAAVANLCAPPTPCIARR